MRPNQKAQLLKLERQQGAKWYCAARRSRIWTKDERRQPERPYLVFVMEGETAAMRGFNMTPHPPRSGDIEKVLVEAMLLTGDAPKDPHFRPYRPAQIVLEDQVMVQALTPRLAEIGVDILLAPSTMQMMDDVNIEFSAHVQEDKRLGLLEIAGVSTPIAAEFFAAAHDFYNAKPWANLNNLSVIGVRYPAEDTAARECYMSIMGNGGMEFGLALYNSVDDINRMMDERKAREFAKSATTIGITFDKAPSLPFGDHDAVEKYGWPIVGPQAYPAILKHHPRQGFVAPTPAEVALFTAALRAIPGFVRSHAHLRFGVVKPQSTVSITYELPAAHEGKHISLRYPVEGILEPPDEEDEVNEIIDDPAEVAALMKLLNDHLPIPCKPTQALVESMRTQKIALRPHQTLQIEHVLDSGNEGGIMGAVSLGKGQQVLVVSLTKVIIDPKHPVYEWLQPYLKRRRRALR
jgi:hypothetical protein